MDVDLGKRTAFVASELLVRALGLVALGYDGRDVAAGGRVALLGRHAGHVEVCRVCRVVCDGLFGAVSRPSKCGGERVLCYGAGSPDIY